VNEPLQTSAKLFRNPTGGETDHSFLTAAFAAVQVVLSASSAYGAARAWAAKIPTMRKTELNNILTTQCRMMDDGRTFYLQDT
jgi:hypothetical protein